MMKNFGPKTSYKNIVIQTLQHCYLRNANAEIKYVIMMNSKLNIPKHLGIENNNQA
jgi:hypothetical protein